jgi:hypothetical protein
MIRSITNFIEALKIFAKFEKNGFDTSFFFEAEHDQIFSHISPEQVPTDSEFGKLLTSYGWHIDSNANVWSYFT